MRRGARSGACGWGDDVKSPPFSAMIAAGNAKIYLHGKGCGDCYQIKCNRIPYCSRKPITVTITEECSGACNDVPFHFDLSGTAFGAMASPGQDENLRNLGQPNKSRKHKDRGKTNPYWFAIAIEFVDGLGEVQSVKIAPAGSKNFVPMRLNWGAVWEANIDPSFRGPFSFLLTSPTRKAITAYNVVPSNFVPRQTYHSNVNF
ncbi:hypothetical protein L6452_27763 [Arctium lappa]|uniref:Uncharacterized protein n=1 Tax=Arctium lappa TaxID=4217 RepID=A0ACB8ZWL8_ARCLA|nr:hypothetical protein L6452_27763 [Arctium lappa]